MESDESDLRACFKIRHYVPNLVYPVNHVSFKPDANIALLSSIDRIHKIDTIGLFTGKRSGTLWAAALWAAAYGLLKQIFDLPLHARVTLLSFGNNLLGMKIMKAWDWRLRRSGLSMQTTDTRISISRNTQSRDITFVSPAAPAWISEGQRKI